MIERPNIGKIRIQCRLVRNIYTSAADVGAKADECTAQFFRRTRGDAYQRARCCRSLGDGEPET
jgi:hypothetical protein